MMGLDKRPSVSDYFATNSIHGSPFFTDYMGEKNYFKIKNNLHLHVDVDDDAAAATPTGIDKVRQILALFQAACETVYRCARAMSLDEMMVATKSKYAGMKQRMPAKPIRDGIKIFALCCALTGYLFAFSVFEGGDKYDDVGLGATGNMVVSLVKKVVFKGHIIVMDNFFPTVNTFAYLKTNLKQNAIGTMRTNRIPSHSLPNVKKADPPGTIQEVSRIESPHLLCSGWRDKAAVLFLSTMHRVGERTELMRQTGAQVNPVEAPAVAELYNENMGGVDRNDRMRACYKTQRSSKRWWLVLFYWMVDCACINAFICYKVYHPDVTHVQFRRELGEILVKKRADDSGCPAPKRRRVRDFGALSQDRYTNHVPVWHEKSRFECTNCRLKRGERVTCKIKCKACRTALCLVNGCFAEVHTPET